MLVQTPAPDEANILESEYPLSHRREPAIPLPTEWHLVTSVKLAWDFPLRVSQYFESYLILSKLFMVILAKFNGTFIKLFQNNLL